MSGQQLEVKCIASPDELSQLPLSDRRILRFADGSSVTHFVFRPGWRWEGCVLPHFVYMISGQLAVKMHDGTERIVGAGEAAFVPPGHDMWVVGDGPHVLLDYWSAEIAKTYQRPDPNELRRRNELAARRMASPE